MKLIPQKWFLIEACFDELVKYFTVVRDSTNPNIDWEERWVLFDMFGDIAEEVYKIIERSDTEWK